MSVELFVILLLGLLVLFLALGLPIAFAAGGAGLVGLLLNSGFDRVFLIASRTFQNMDSYILIAIAPFVFMGLVIERSGIGNDLFETIYQWAGRLKGSLAITSIIVCTILAATTGIVGAAVATVGMIGLPAMLKYGYDRRLALGACCAGGSLGVLIPPSIILIIYGSATGTSVGKLFMGGFATGGLLVILYILYVSIRSTIQPNFAPQITNERELPLYNKILLLKSVIVPIIIVIVVLGTIFLGLATPTEAASVGAVCTLIFASFRKEFTWQTFRDVLTSTVRVTCMVMWIIVGSSFFVSVFASGGGAQLVDKLLLTYVGSDLGILILIMFILFFLGCFMDSIAIVLLCAPIFAPIIVSLGYDPIWFGIIFNLNLQMAYITPPFGYSLFYLKGVAPHYISTGDIFRSVVPFILLQLLALILCIKYPILATWLVDLFGGR